MELVTASYTSCWSPGGRTPFEQNHLSNVSTDTKISLMCLGHWLDPESVIPSLHLFLRHSTPSSVTHLHISPWPHSSSPNFSSSLEFCISSYPGDSSTWVCKLKTQALLSALSSPRVSLHQWYQGLQAQKFVLLHLLCPISPHGLLIFLVINTSLLFLSFHS